MEVHTERLITDRIIANAGADVDLSQATRFMLPQMPTASLPPAATVNGMLVWDTSAGALKLAAGSAWEIVAIVT